MLKVVLPVVLARIIKTVHLDSKSFAAVCSALTLTSKETPSTTTYF